MEGKFLPVMDDRFDPAVGIVAPLIRGVDLAGNPITIDGAGETTFVIV